MPELTIDDFITDLQNLHQSARNFHEKWDDVSSTLVVTREQQLLLSSIWEQHDAWYQDKIDAAKNKI